MANNPSHSSLTSSLASSPLNPHLLSILISMSETTTKDFLHKLPTDKMQMPPGIDVQSLIAWFEQFRVNVQAVVYDDTANNLQAFMAIMAHEKAIHYVSHQVIGARLLESWGPLNRGAP